jgi:hypothetical protein
MLGKGRLCKGGEKEEGSRVGNKVIIGMLYKMKLPLITRHFAYLKVYSTMYFYFFFQF